MKEEKILEELIYISCGKMLEEIDRFKEEKFDKYYRNLLLCAKVSKVNIKILEDLWSSVSEEKNIKRVKDCS